MNSEYQNPVQTLIRVSNSMDPDQARRFVGPDLGTNCLQSYQHSILLGKEFSLSWLKTPKVDFLVTWIIFFFILVISKISFMSIINAIGFGLVI